MGFYKYIGQFLHHYVAEESFGGRNGNATDVNVDVEVEVEVEAKDLDARMQRLSKDGTTGGQEG